MDCNLGMLITLTVWYNVENIATYHVPPSFLYMFILQQFLTFNDYPNIIIF